MKEQHISVIIADRPYRLKVGNEQEEQHCRMAKELINTKMKDYAQQFAFRDKQDLLAMVALQLAVDMVKADNHSRFHDTLQQKLSDMEKLLDNCLNEQ